MAALCERGLTSGTAESCTAGMIAARLGNVPGASATLLGGFVAYANDVKTAQVGVPAELIERHAVPDHGRSSQQLGLDQRDCGRLLRQLDLHLRLEERWLGRLHSFCGGHGSSHRQAATLAAEGWARGKSLRGARLPWLMDLQEWFHRHRHGVDAIAYRRAEAQARARP